MKKILLLSDTHSYMGEDVLQHVREADEVWHGGDVGKIDVLDQLEALKPTRGVYGNIDTADMRERLPLNNFFECEGVKVFITHIGGYPGRYYKRVSALIKEYTPDLYICGHSHITKVMRDSDNNLLHMNPGACGNHGFHKFRTMLRFQCNDGKIENLDLIELGARGALS